MRGSSARKWISRRTRALACVERGRRKRLPITGGRQASFRSNGPFPVEYSFSTPLTTTKRERMRFAQQAGRAMHAIPSFLFPAGRQPEMAPQAHLFHRGFHKMHVLVDLKICESCGSLWYRANGGLQVYCNCCAAKLGDFPSPRTRPRPGGKRKRAVAAVAFLKVPAGGEL